MNQRLVEMLVFRVNLKYLFQVFLQRVGFFDILFGGNRRRNNPDEEEEDDDDDDDDVEHSMDDEDENVRFREPSLLIVLNLWLFLLLGR